MATKSSRRWLGSRPVLGARRSALGDDAVSVWTALGIDQRSPLPLWYMPPATGGTPPRPGWRRRAAIAVIVAFVAINAYGLCNTYGDILSR